MSVRALVGATTHSLAVSGAMALPGASVAPAPTAADDGPGRKTVWTEADKTGFGTPVDQQQVVARRYLR